MPKPFKHVRVLVLIPLPQLLEQVLHSLQVVPISPNFDVKSITELRFRFGSSQQQPVTPPAAYDSKLTILTELPSHYWTNLKQLGNHCKNGKSQRSKKA